MRRWINLEMLYIIIAAGIAGWLLFAGVFIGVADNGDFLRIMGSAGLNYYHAMESYEDRFFGFSHMYFAYDTFFRGFYPSTQIVLVVIARFIGVLFNGSAFDIRILGAIYTLLLLTAGYLIIKHNKTKSLLAGAALTALMLLVFTDVGYLAYFNSLFGEPVSFVFMLLTFALGLMLVKQEKPGRYLLVLFFAAIWFLVCSKTQNAPIGFGFALLGLRYAWMSSERGWRKLGIALSVVTFVASVVMYVAAPKDFKHINLYQTVFFGILNGSPDVEGDLRKLGLPEHLEVLAGTNYFQTDTAIKQNDPSLQQDFYERISHKDILFFYLTNPSRLIERMEYAAEHSMTIRPHYLGNYEKSAGKPAGTNTFAYSAWSELKRHDMPNQLWFIVAVFALFFAAAAYEWLRSRGKRLRIAVELFILLGLTGIFSFLIPILGDGLADLSKHLFLFNVVFDMMLVTAAVWLVYRIGQWAGARRKRMRQA